MPRSLIPTHALVTLHMPAEQPQAEPINTFEMRADSAARNVNRHARSQHTRGWVWEYNETALPHAYKTLRDMHVANIAAISSPAVARRWRVVTPTGMRLTLDCALRLERGLAITRRSHD